MVHALKQAHRLLRSQGVLINIHYLPAPQLIEVHEPETIHKVGWLLDRDDYDAERSAFNALAQVVEDRYFSLKDQHDFTQNIYEDDLIDFRKWLAEWWESAILPDRINQRLEELMQTADQSAKIVLAMKARMIKLNAV